MVEFLLPFLNLPPRAASKVVKSLDGMDVISFSLISRDTKKQVEEAEFKGSDLTLRFAPNLDLLFVFEGLDLILGLTEWHPMWEPEPTDIFLAVPVKIEEWISEYCFPQTRFIRISKFSARDWIEHIMCIFHFKSINLLNMESDKGLYTLDSLAEELGGIKISRMNVPDSDVKDQNYRYQLVELFQPDQISIPIDAFIEKQVYHKILVQHFSVIRFQPLTIINLDDILITNSKALVFDHCHITVGNFNKFIKLWRKGSNGQVECIIIRQRPVWLPEVLFKGIKYTAINEDFEMNIPELDENDVLAAGLRRGGFRVFSTMGWTADFYFNANGIELFIGH